MIKFKKLGGVAFDYPLYEKEQFSAKSAKGKAYDTIGGSKIVFESVKRNNANYITLISKKSGWMRESTLNDILTLLDDIDVEVTLVTTDEIEIKVRPALEFGDIVKVTEIGNETTGWFEVEILLCRV